MELTLRSVRVCHGYTVEEVAEHCGVTAEEMEGYEKGTYENGDILIGTIRRLRALYGIPVDLFLHIETEAELIEYNRLLAAEERAKKATA